MGKRRKMYWVSTYDGGLCGAEALSYEINNYSRWDVGAMLHETIYNDLQGDETAFIVRYDF